MSIETKFNQIEVYGITSFLGQMISIVGTICVIVFEIVALKNKYQVIKERFSHLSSTLMFVVMGIYFFLSLYADAAHGFMSTPALSPSVTLISFFILIHKVHYLHPTPEIMIINYYIKTNLEKNIFCACGKITFYSTLYRLPE